MIKKSSKSNTDFISGIFSIRSDLLNTCRKHIFDFHTAEDIVQDTLRILVEKQDDYDPNKSLSGWAYRILFYQIKAHLTKCKRSKLVYSETTESYSNKVFSNNVERWKTKHVPIIDLLDHTDPISQLIDKEKDEDNLIKMAFIFSIIGDKPSRFLKLYLKGHSRKFIMQKLNMKQTSYYQTKMRIIRKVKKAIKCTKV